MGGFKRLIFILYFLLSVLGVGYLFCYWFGYGPVLNYLAPWSSTTWFYWAVIGCVGICIIGVLVIFFRALFTPSKKKRLHVNNEFGSIEIEKKALGSVVRETVALHPELEMLDCWVTIRNRRKSPSIKAYVKAAPRSVETLGTLSEQLQAEVKKALEDFSNVSVRSVELKFKRPKDSKQAVSAVGTNPPVITADGAADTVTSATASTAATTVATTPRGVDDTMSSDVTAPINASNSEE